MTAALSAAE
jgi:hypothetical protein